ncbi:PE domain-containing protein [Pseudonocardia sp. T1-2H]|uniref:PE domain-containing protein n=1 Tax=Pseudonocardia sp. T1-2H TaxID=3128899 RepID=UPI003100ACD2
MGESTGGLEGEAYEHSRQKVLNDLAESRVAIELSLRPGPGGVGTGFRVDPEKAQACIDELTAVIRDLRFAVTAGSALAFAPPSQDPVSINVARNAGEMATRAQEWMLAWIAQLESTRNGLQHQLEAYRAQDSESALTL